MKFNKHFRKIFKFMQQLDKQKINGPKYSEMMEPLYKYIKETVDMSSDGMSTMTSQLSVFGNTQKGSNSTQKMALLNQMLNVSGSEQVEVHNGGSVHQQNAIPVVRELNESFASEMGSRTKSGRKIVKKISRKKSMGQSKQLKQNALHSMAN